MRRAYERGIKARLSFSGGPHAPVNMADSMQNGRYLDCLLLLFFCFCFFVFYLKKRWKSRRTSMICKNLACQIQRSTAQQTCHFLRFFFSTDIHFYFPNTIRHVYRGVWPAREAKPRFGAALVRSSRHENSFPKCHFWRFSPPILSAMFPGTCGPPEKLSLALVQRWHVLRMIVKLAYSNQLVGTSVVKILCFSVNDNTPEKSSPKKYPSFQNGKKTDETDNNNTIQCNSI